MTLYLLPIERDLYDNLPAKLKQAWEGEVVEETGTAWETDEQLLERIAYARNHLPPKVKTTMQKMLVKADVSGLDSLAAGDLSNQALYYILFALGAVGMTGIISEALRTAGSVEDLTAIEECASVRHQILQNNLVTLHQ